MNTHKQNRFYRCIFRGFRRRRRQQTTLKNVQPLGTAYLSLVELYGLRMENSEALVDYDERGVPQILVQRNTTFRLFGSGWTDKTLFVLTEKTGNRGGPCEFPIGDVEEVRIQHFNDHRAAF